MPSICSAQLDDFSDCKATLSALDQALDAGYEKTNQNLKSGKNPFLTIRPNGRFHVSTPKQEEVERLSLGTFFPDRRYIRLLEESVQSCGQVMLTWPDGFGQGQAGSLCANDGMRLPKSH